MKACLMLLALTAAVPHFEQRVGAPLPLDEVWRDETGAPISLGSCFLPGRPAVIVFGYYRCAQLCSLVERSAIDTLRALRPSVGDDFAFIYLSIDSTDMPEAARIEREAAVRAYGRGDSALGWHYLTGAKEVIARTAGAAGFEYRYDPSSRQFAHPAGFIVATPSGIVAQYFFGLDASADTVAAALRRARTGATGPSVFALLLECFHGGIGASPRERAIWDGLWAAVGLTVAVLAGGIGWMLREERQKRRAP